MAAWIVSDYFFRQRRNRRYKNNNALERKGETGKMKVVQPIRDLEKLEECYRIAREHDKGMPRGALSWELMLIVGLNTSLRVSDFTRFRVDDLRGKEYAQITAKKTGKEARILINPAARREIMRLTNGRNGREWVFKSRQNDPFTRSPRPITRQRAYQIINHIAKQAVIDYAFGKLNAHRVFAETIDAVKSVRLMEKLGMRFEGILKSHTADSLGQYADRYLYGLLKTDWKKADG